jgi:signal transduction histidine kinase
LKRYFSFASRLTLAMALLLLAFGGAVAILAQRLAEDHAQEAQQRLAHGLARHIVAQWPRAPQSDGTARGALVDMLRVVNPGVQVYVLDAEGRVRDYLGDPGMVRTPQVNLSSVQAFLKGAPLPLRGTDPMGSDRPRIFSAAMFPPSEDQTGPPGYLYIVLDAGPALAPTHVRWVALAVAASALLGTALLGALVFGRLTLPLRRLARRIQGYVPPAAVPSLPADEVEAIERAFDDLTTRIEAQTAQERRLARDHRETMAGVAHDLRTPLTALHGQLEALTTGAGHDPALSSRLLQSALAQSEKLRRLTQQLFELAALQDTAPATSPEHFRLDELVSDTVLKLASPPGQPRVQLLGPAPEALGVEGDMQLIERALTNLIDNARRHAGAVQVRLQRDGDWAQVLIEDQGPGLPAALHQRLEAGRSLREAPLWRPGGGIGGLGLAIAQRVALLHGGRLSPLPAPQGGTRLCLALPLAKP